MIAGGGSPRRKSLLRSPRRLLLAGLGVACVGLALLGVIVPGLPTTIFLIAASYLFARSFPQLEERFFRFRIFRPFLPYVRGERAMTLRMRLLAIVTMWAAVSFSLWLLATGGRLPVWLGVVLVSAAVVGTLFILNFRKEPR